MRATLDLLTRSLPESFPFYHLGEIALSRKTEPSGESRSRVALGFTLRGDIQAAVILWIDENSDLSVYSEVGNIIASRLVTTLSERDGVDVVLSPPLKLNSAQLDLIAASSTDVARRTYVHSHQGKQILLETLIFLHSRYAHNEAPQEAVLETTAGYARPDGGVS